MGDVELLFEADPRVIDANGQSASELRLLARDSNNNPVKNALIRFTTGLGTVTASAVTDEDGYAKTAAAAWPELSSEKINGIATVTATYADSVIATTSVAFAGVSISVLAYPEALTTGEVCAITAKLDDPAQQPIADQEIELSISSKDSQNLPSAVFSDGSQTIVLKTDPYLSCNDSIYRE